MKIMLVAGEASGDILGGALAKALTEQKPNLALFGMGGERMREAGVDTAVDISETAVAGIVEIARHYPRLRSILKRLASSLEKQKPDLLVLVDYPEFNLKLAKYAKNLSIPVLYYVSPQLWAWRSGRIKHIQERVKLMAVLLPFEVDFYQSANVPVRLVRHPLLEQVTPENRYKELRAEFNIPKDHQVVTLLPGSRNSEIQRLLPLMAACASRLKELHPSLTFILPVASTINKNEVHSILNESSAKFGPCQILYLTGSKFRPNFVY